MSFRAPARMNMYCSRRRPLVRIGNTWRFFSQALPDHEMLGTIQRGLEIGALAKVAGGKYVQLNGSVVQKLNTGLVEAAIVRAQRGVASCIAPPSIAPPENTQCAAEQPIDNASNTPEDACAPAKPTVLYKKRRTLLTAAERRSP